MRGPARRAGAATSAGNPAAAPATLAQVGRPTAPVRTKPTAPVRTKACRARTRVCERRARRYDLHLSRTEVFARVRQGIEKLEYHKD